MPVADLDDPDGNRLAGQGPNRINPDWARVAGSRDGENPARWKAHLENLLPKKNKVRPVEHHAALHHSQIGAFMAELRQQEGVAALALELVILTASRAAKSSCARWSKLDLNAKVWTIPAERMKAAGAPRAAFGCVACHRREDGRAPAAMITCSAAAPAGRFPHP
jgi:integrase